MQGRVATRIQTDGESNLFSGAGGSDSFTRLISKPRQLLSAEGAMFSCGLWLPWKPGDSPAAIERLDQKRNVTITASMEGRGSGWKRYYFKIQET